MAVEITGVPGAPLPNHQTAKTDTHNTGVVGLKSGLSNDKATASAPSTDSVTISPQAERLRLIETTVNAQPDVDDARIESLKSAIDAGNYDIDPQRVAEKLIELESQFVA